MPLVSCTVPCQARSCSLPGVHNERYAKNAVGRRGTRRRVCACHAEDSSASNASRCFKGNAGASQQLVMPKQLACTCTVIPCTAYLADWPFCRRVAAAGRLVLMVEWRLCLPALRRLWLHHLMVVSRTALTLVWFWLICLDYLHSSRQHLGQEASDSACSMDSVRTLHTGGLHVPYMLTARSAADDKQPPSRASCITKPATQCHG